MKVISLYLLVTLLLFLGLGALSGGYLLMVDPDGSALGMDSEWLKNSPFNTYLVPGIILFFFNGLFPILTIVGIIFKPRIPFLEKINIFKTQNWAWSYSLYSGIMAIAWIIVQQAMTNYFWLQTVILVTGLLIIITTLLPGVTSAFKNGNQ
ncbi:MAG TPA: hypothetical protein VK177_10630 [Flavobacteriales bacterium]|nr:hypothetical protein [Flavobacteriales bacterium]